LKSALDRLRDAGKHASEVSNQVYKAQVIVSKTGIEVKASRVVNGSVDRRETLLRLHSDLLADGESGRGEIVDTIDRVMDRIKHVSVQELVAHLEPGTAPPINIRARA
jgi:hypothetical protein